MMGSSLQDCACCQSDVDLSLIVDTYSFVVVDLCMMTAGVSEGGCKTIFIRVG